MQKKNQTEEIFRLGVTKGILEVRTDGTIWRVKNCTGCRWTGKVLENPCVARRAEANTGRYLVVHLMSEGKKHTCQASRLVWRSLKGKIPEGMTINHKNGVKTDNRPENLELATYREQALHALHVLKVGRTDQNGEKNTNHVLTKTQALEIIAERDAILATIHTRHNRRMSELAAKFGVSYQTVWDVVRGRRWQSAM